MSKAKILTVLLLGIAVATIFAADKTVNFSGEWVLNSEKSQLDDMGTQFLPAKLEVQQEGNDMTVARVYEREYEDPIVDEVKLTLDGQECKSQFWNSPRTTTAKWSEDGKSLNVQTKVVFERDGQTSELNINEVWSMKEKALAIDHSSSSSFGDRKVTMIFDKKPEQKEKEKEKVKEKEEPANK